jgi:PBP1b-binding outer membrane lipoprotein LpoB
MKLVKISIVALSMGLFLASCGGNTEATAPVEDTTVTAPVVEEVVAPVVDSAAAMVDSAAAPAAEAPATH